jgi:hypothetical protein
VVSGISTGALIAPFAFLGPAFDGVLKSLYTSTQTQDLISKRRLFTRLKADSAVKASGMRELIRKYIDHELLARIADEYAKGRHLFVGTTNLDTGEPVVWDMGKIASLGNEQALDLFRDVLVASAAIPGAFPPVYIKVESGGITYDEMHVDGGVSTQVFVLPARLARSDEDASARPERRVWIIRNSKLTVEPIIVEPKLIRIAMRSVDMLIVSQAAGDLYRIYLHAEHDGTDFNLAFIPGDFSEEPKEAFDSDYMSKLFEVGFRQARAGYSWAKAPPGFADLLPAASEQTEAGEARR